MSESDSNSASSPSEDEQQNEESEICANPVTSSNQNGRASKCLPRQRVFAKVEGKSKGTMEKINIQNIISNTIGLFLATFSFRFIGTLREMSC